MKVLILISPRETDAKFFTSLVEPWPCRVFVPKDWRELIPILSDKSDAVVVWATEDASREDLENVYPAAAITKVLRDYNLSKTGRTFLLTDKSINDSTALVGLKDENALSPDWFPNSLIRRYDAASLELYRKMIQLAYDPTLPRLASFAPEGTKVHKIVLKQSEVRKAAVDAMQSILAKVGVHERIATKAAQATDELLLNAIFDAASDGHGALVRQRLDRKAKFVFAPNEYVDLELVVTDKFVGIGVTDRYGSLRKEVIYKYLRQNYHDEDYVPRKSGPGAGLGLYGIIEMGLSLLLVTKRNVSTNAMVFVPMCKEYKTFKNQFQFRACFSD